MSKGLVLISGINGYIAAVTAKQFLEAGFSVRGTVRKASSAQSLIDGPLKDYAQAGKFEVVEVPDITVDGAFDEAVKDVTVIAHLASPVSFAFTDPEPVLHAAINGTKTILESALKANSPDLKTVIIMSSIAAVWSHDKPGYTFTEKDWNHGAEEEAKKLGKNTPGPVIYSASKNAAERVFWEFRDEKKPKFAMTAVNPVFVIGPPISPPKTPTEVPQTTFPIFSVFRGDPLVIPPPLIPFTVDVRDVAALFIYAAQRPDTTNGERYIAHSAVGGPQAIADILREAYPDRKGFIDKGEPGKGYRKDWGDDGSWPVTVDSGKAERLLGGWIPFGRSVLDTVGAFEGLV